MGIDAGGNRLDPIMPRFRLSTADAAALLAYIRRLGSLPDMGLNDQSLVLGTVLGAHEAASDRVLSAYLAQVNRDGGLFGRQLVLHIDRPEPGELPSRSIVRLIRTDAILALLAPVIAGDESNSVAVADTDGMPMIGPSIQSIQMAPRSRYVFYLNGGVESEARALVSFAGTLPGRPLVVDDGTAVWHAAAVAAVAKMSADGRPPEPLSPEDPSLFARLGPVLWFADRGPHYNEQKAREAIQPMLLVPGELATYVLSREAPARTWLAFTSGPPDVTAAAASEYRELAAQYDLPRGDQPAQRQALAAAKIFVEALRRAGREVTRERLVKAMEGLQDFHTGLIPPVSYSTTRRIGTDGVWIVPLGGGTPIWWNR